MSCPGELCLYGVGYLMDETGLSWLLCAYESVIFSPFVVSASKGE